jgi:hypothetical protein
MAGGGDRSAGLDARQEDFTGLLREDHTMGVRQGDEGKRRKPKPQRWWNRGTGGRQDYKPTEPAMDNLIEPRRHITGWLQPDLICMHFTCICHSSKIGRAAVRIARTLLPARSLRLSLPRIGLFGCVVAPLTRDTHCDFQSNLRLSTAAGHSKPALHTRSKLGGAHSPTIWPSRCRRRRQFGCCCSN